MQQAFIASVLLVGIDVDGRVGLLQLASLVHEGRKGNVLLGDAVDSVCGKNNINRIVHVLPFGMVILLLRVTRSVSGRVCRLIGVL
jgi:hypothetical protein